MGKIKLVVLGAGNAFSVMLQGLHYYKDSHDGLWHRLVGGYKVSDIELVGVYDIDQSKVDKDLARVIPEDLRLIDLEDTGIKVSKGILVDELSKPLKDRLRIVSNSYEMFLEELKDLKPDVVLNLISSGLDNTTRLYAKAALSVNSSFINATPTDLKDLIMEFDRSRVILVGDDLMSQFGGTAFHKGIVEFMLERGIKVEKSYQLDVGGTLETLNTMQDRIKQLKRKVKTNSINIELPYEFESVAGTTEYVEFFKDLRVSYYWIKGKGFLGTPITIDITLRTHDGPNASNVLLDVVRAVKYSMDIGELDAKYIISAYGFKNPPRVKGIRDAKREFVEYFCKC